MNLKKLTEWLGKYKYAVLVLLVGIALLAWPSGEKAPAVQQMPEQTQATEETLEQKLERLLSQVDGAGQVRVLLTQKTGPEYIYQTDTVAEAQQQDEESSTSTSTQTVLISVDGTQEAVIAQTIYPTYQGAVVLCQGGDQPKVRLDLIEAVSSLTGLSADKITVIKMTEQQEENT